MEKFKSKIDNRSKFDKSAHLVRRWINYVEAKRLSEEFAESNLQMTL